MDYNKVIEENRGLVISVANKLYSKNRFYSQEDLEQVGYLSMLKSLPKYNESRGKISTFIVTCIKNDMIKFMNKNKYRQHVSSYASSSYENSSHIYEYENSDPIFNEVVRRKSEGQSNNQICKQLDISKNKLKIILNSIRKSLEE